MLVALTLEGPLDSAAKLVEAAGKGNLAFASFLVLVVAAAAWKFFGKDAQWLRICAFLLILANIIFVVFVLAVPTPPQQRAATDNPKTQPASPRPAIHCSGEKELVFTPKTPGVMQTNPNGSRVDLGDGGGGTRLEEWAYSWKAPAAVSSVTCTSARNEHVLAQNRNGSTAQCVGSINGGDDAMTMHVVWNGPCD